jgi:hypothetical protein
MLLSHNKEVSIASGLIDQIKVINQLGEVHKEIFCVLFSFKAQA